MRAAALCLAVLGLTASLWAGPAFRTDGGDEKLPWFKLVPGQFPPDGAAHEISGELISIDGVNRSGWLRQDRTDAMRSDDWDRPLPFALLAYGSIRYHGAPAELRDVPLGTHLHGQFFWEEKAGKEGKGEFTKALRLEDDFSYFARQQRVWKLEKVAPDKVSIEVTPQNFTAKPTKFLIGPGTSYWLGSTVAAADALAPGQALLLNLTVCTLKGPGRCTDVWIDDASRELATRHQLGVHRQFVHDRGLPGWVEAVDNQAGVATIALFAGFDPDLLKDFPAKAGIAACVAEENLRTYDQNNDSMRGDMLDISSTPPAPGDSGTRLKFKPQIMLEGCRPGRILRVFAGGWRVDDLPKEERLYE